PRGHSANKGRQPPPAPPRCGRRSAYLPAQAALLRAVETSPCSWAERIPFRSPGQTECRNDRSGGFFSAWAFMKEVVNLARGLSTDSRHLGEVDERRPFNCLERPEMMKQRALACGPDSGYFLQA